MTGKNELLFRRWLDEVWNKGREEVIEELFDENAVALYSCVPSETPVRGIKTFKAFCRYIRNTFHELEVIIEDIVAEDEKVIAQCRVLAKKPDKTKDDGYRKIEVSGLCVVKIRDGKIIEAWNNLSLADSDRKIDNLLLKPL